MATQGGREFDIRLPLPGHFVRVVFDEGITAFTVQYEMVAENVTTPIVRYDSAHGKPHRDLLDRSGNTRQKRFLEMSNQEALTFAQNDIKANWRHYLDDFQRSES